MIYYIISLSRTVRVRRFVFGFKPGLVDLPYPPITYIMLRTVKLPYINTKSHGKRNKFVSYRKKKTY